MTIEIGKSYKVRNEWYRVLKIEGGKVFAQIGKYVLPYDVDQFEHMLRRK